MLGVAFAAVLILTLSLLSGCAPQGTSDAGTEATTTLNTTTGTPATESTATATPASIGYAGHWIVTDRLRFAEGTVVSLVEAEDGTARLSLKIITNYHSGADPIDNPNYPFELGSTQEFILKQMPSVSLEIGTDVVVYQADFILSSDDTQSFLGAAILYYKSGDQYVDMQNNVATMPPQDDPNWDALFNP